MVIGVVAVVAIVVVLGTLYAAGVFTPKSSGEGGPPPQSPQTYAQAAATATAKASGFSNGNWVAAYGIGYAADTSFSLPTSYLDNLT